MLKANQETYDGNLTIKVSGNSTEIVSGTRNITVSGINTETYLGKSFNYN